VAKESLATLIRQAKAQVVRGSFLVRRAQRRVEKFHRKWGDAKKARNRAKKAKKPKKAETYQRRMARNKRKTIYWSKREADAIEFSRGWKKALARRLKKKAASQPNGRKLVETADKYLGTNEGSNLQRRWANELGYSSYLPWCSIFVGQMLMEAYGWPRSKLPGNPAYSGAWVSWSGGQRVNVSDRQPGDILVFDWGDGGLSDHVAIYAGGGQHVGGNQSDQVNRRSTPVGNIVSVIRPRL
jgi:cell wall-associated NlpC family hydrolase